MRTSVLAATIAVAGLAGPMPGRANADAVTAGAPHPGGGPAPRAIPTARVPVADVTPRPLPALPDLPAPDPEVPAQQATTAYEALGRTRDGVELHGAVPAVGPRLPDLPRPVPPPVPDTPGLERTADASVWPERTAGMLVAQFGPVAGYCSAVLVGPATVLTAAHCIYDHTLGWADEITFLPGLNGQHTPPFGAWTYGAAHVVSGFVTEYRESYADVVGYDLAVVTLEVPVGAWLGWAGFGPEVEDGAQVRLRAYPGDRPFGTMWQADCTLALSESWHRQAPPLALHRCPAFPGSSGGGMADDTAMLRALTVATSPEGGVAVVLGPVQAAWITALWQ